MTTKESDDIIKKMAIGVRRGAARAQARHKKAGLPIYVWQKGQVVEIPPDEIEPIEINEKKPPKKTKDIHGRPAKLTS